MKFYLFSVLAKFIFLYFLDTLKVEFAQKTCLRAPFYSACWEAIFPDFLRAAFSASGGGNFGEAR